MLVITQRTKYLYLLLLYDSILCINVAKCVTFVIDCISVMQKFILLNSSQVDLNWFIHSILIILAYQCLHTPYDPIQCLIHFHGLMKMGFC